MLYHLYSFYIRNMISSLFIYCISSIQCNVDRCNVEVLMYEYYIKNFAEIGNAYAGYITKLSFGCQRIILGCLI